MGPFIVTGLVSGSIYAVSVLGLVLTYNSSRVFNFAHGAVAYLTAVAYYWLTSPHFDQQWAAWPAALLCVLVFAPLLGFVLWQIVLRNLTDAPPVVRFVSTVGLWVAIPALAGLFFGTTVVGGQDAPPGLAGDPPGQFEVIGVTVNWTQASIVIGAAVVALGLWLLLRFTPLGLSTRAAVDSPRVAAIAGINTSAIGAITWMLGFGLAGFAGVLLSPVVGLAPFQYTLLLVVSFAAVVVGRLRSLPLAFAGAIVIGLLQGLSEKYIPDWFGNSTSTFSTTLQTGFKQSLPFIVMLVVLLAYQGLRREQFETDLRAGPTQEEVAPATKLTGWRAAIGPAAFAIALLSVPAWPGVSDFDIGVLCQVVALGVLFLTFTVVTGEGGMLSLAQMSLAGVGAFAAAKLATNADWPVWAAILVGALIAVPVGLLVAGLSLRLGGLYLALATLALSQLIRFLIFARSDFDNFNTGVPIERPKLLGINFEDFGIGRTNFYILLVIVFGVVALAVVNLRRSTTGLALTAMRSSEQASATIGISVVRTKLIAFGLSAFIAGLGGALYADTVGSATVNTWDILVGIVWLAIVVTWGIRSVLGALLAALLYVEVSAPQNRISFIFVIIVVFVIFGMTARLIGSRMIYRPKGMALAALLYAAGITAIVFLLKWKTVKEDINLGSAWDYIPTVLFGVGAVFLARRPQGVLFDVMNRIRLRNMRREARLREGAAPAEVST